MQNLSYYDHGKEHFKRGYPIYVNKTYEPVQPHLHAHDFIEIAYVYSGQGVHRIGDNEYPVKKGDLYLINYNTPHEFRSLCGSDKSKSCIVCNCIFKPEFIDATLMTCRDFNDIAGHLLFRSLFPEEVEALIDVNLIGVNVNQVESIYEKMLFEYENQQDGYIELLRAYVTELLIMIFRAIRKADRNGTNTMSSNGKVIDKLIAHLKDNYHSTLKLQDLSMVVFLSPNYISKLFKDHTGQTVTEYVQNIRIEEACRLLTRTDKKVIEIAQSVGYSDIKHFLSVFRRCTGISPSTYRGKHGIHNVT